MLDEMLAQYSVTAEDVKARLEALVNQDIFGILPDFTEQQPINFDKLMEDLIAKTSGFNTNQMLSHSVNLGKVIHSGLTRVKYGDRDEDKVIESVKQIKDNVNQYVGYFNEVVSALESQRADLESYVNTELPRGSTSAHADNVKFVLGLYLYVAMVNTELRTFDRDGQRYVSIKMPECYARGEFNAGNETYQSRKRVWNVGVTFKVADLEFSRSIYRNSFNNIVKVACYNSDVVNENPEGLDSDNPFPSTYVVPEERRTRPCVDGNFRNYYGIPAPHISCDPREPHGSGQCWGNLEGLLNPSWQAKDINTWLITYQSTLSDYNPRSPYGRLEDYGEICIDGEWTREFIIYNGKAYLQSQYVYSSTSNSVIPIDEAVTYTYSGRSYTVRKSHCIEYTGNETGERILRYYRHNLRGVTLHPRYEGNRPSTLSETISMSTFASPEEIAAAQSSSAFEQGKYYFARALKGLQEYSWYESISSEDPVLVYANSGETLKFCKGSRKLNINIEDVTDLIEVTKENILGYILGSRYLRKACKDILKGSSFVLRHDVSYDWIVQDLDRHGNVVASREGGSSTHTTSVRDVSFNIDSFNL